MAIQGLRDTGNFVADQRPLNWRAAMLMLYPNGKMPLTAMTSMMKSEKTDDPQYNWWEKRVQSRRVALGANIGTDTTSFTLTSGAKGFKAGDLLYSEESQEIVRVDADPVSDTAVVVTRGWSGTTPTAITYNGQGVNPNFVSLGSAYPEGSFAPTGVSFDPTKKYNYTQIFRDTLEMTRTAMKTRLRTPDAVKEAKRETLEIHGIGIERALWWGRRLETTMGGSPLRTTGGIESFIDSGNIVTADTSTGTDMEALEEYLYNAFRFGSSEKVGVLGNRALLTINQIVRKNSQVRIMSGIKEFGMNVSRLISPFGEIVLKTHPLFNEMPGGTTGSTRYHSRDSFLYILDMENFRYRYVDDTQYEKKLQADGLDGMKSGYLTEAGLEVHHPLTHYLVKNLALAKTDS